SDLRIVFHLQDQRNADRGPGLFHNLDSQVIIVPAVLRHLPVSTCCRLLGSGGRPVLISIRVASAFAAMTLTSVATAGPFEDGRAAFVEGDYANAMRLLQPLANEGHAGAQYGLGLIFMDGKGVPRNGELAAGWLRKAAEQG